MSALTEALVAAQAELPTAIGRDSQGQGYRYTSLERDLDSRAEAFQEAASALRAAKEQLAHVRL